jgi:ATP-dependent helicase/nuclease subunit A
LHISNPFLNLIKEKFPQFDVQAISSLPIDEMSIKIYESFGLYQIDNGYFTYFLNELLAYKEKYSSSLIDFVEWWEEKQRSIYVKIPDGHDAVSILTIHRSKGLQFPIIIIPYANWKTVNYDNKWVDLPETAGIGLDTAYLKLSKPEDSGLLSKLSLEEISKQNLDHLNLLYVATTRAMDRLYLITEKPSSRRSSSISAWLFEMAMQQSEFKDNLLQYGHRQRKIDKEKKGVEGKEKDVTFRFQSNLEKIILKKNSAQIWDESFNKELEFGNKIHYVLSLIYQKNDLASALDKAIMTGIIQLEDQVKYADYIHKLLDLPESNLFFNEMDEIKTEQEILLENNELIRIDRICIDPNNKVKILDYKTGEKENKHAKQIEQYINALKQLGYNDVSGYLLYSAYQEYVSVV